MYICQCRAVTDRRIRAAVNAGAEDPAELARHCGAGTRCGGCLPALRALLDELEAETKAGRRQARDHAA